MKKLLVLIAITATGSAMANTYDFQIKKGQPDSCAPYAMVVRQTNIFNAEILTVMTLEKDVLMGPRAKEVLSAIIGKETNESGPGKQKKAWAYDMILGLKARMEMRIGRKTSEVAILMANDNGQAMGYAPLEIAYKTSVRDEPIQCFYEVP